MLPFNLSPLSSVHLSLHQPTAGHISCVAPEMAMNIARYTDFRSAFIRADSRGRVRRKYVHNRRPLGREKRRRGRRFEGGGRGG